MKSHEGLIRVLRLFVASYAPLGIILALQHSHRIWPPMDSLAFWLFASLGAIGMADAYRLPRGALRKSHIRVRLTDVSGEGGQVAAYIATYLLPFLGFAINGWRDALSLAIYFGVLFVVFVHSELGLINPALYLTGWHVVSAVREGERILMLVPNKTVLGEGDMYAVAFGRFLVYDDEVELK